MPTSTEEIVFAKLAKAYSLYRPSYPLSLFAHLADLAPARTNVWDCATGNGQAALGLSKYFDQVDATDLSVEQIAHAFPDPKVRYHVSSAEKTKFSDHSFDLVTVAEALHWFDLNSFFAEVRRVLRPGGLLAVWNYGHCQISPEIDQIVAEYRSRILGRYWHQATRTDNVHSQAIPFNEIPVQLPALKESWGLQHFLGYLNSWSASASFKTESGYAATDLIQEQLTARWADGGARMEISWPLYIRAGYF